MDVDFETYAIHAAQRGSEQAWRQLFEWHFDAEDRYCVAMVKQDFRGYSVTY